MDFEEIAMQLIAHSGESRTAAFEALKAAKAGDFAKAEELIEESKKESLEAHNVQTQLLFAQANGEEIAFSVLLTHAQDHFMSSALAQELIVEMIDMLRR